MSNINPLDLGFERPATSGLSGDLEVDFQKHGIPQETKNPGAADASSLARVFDIHCRIAAGTADLEDARFLFQMNQALFHDAEQLKKRCDELKHEYLKLAYEKKKI